MKDLNNAIDTLQSIASSIIETQMKANIAREMLRVLKPDGVLWIDAPLAFWTLIKYRFTN